MCLDLIKEYMQSNHNLSPDIRNIFVIFPPGLGGNHLANLLSTDSRFVTRSNSEDYSRHKENNAHTSPLQNLNIDDIDSILDNTSNIFCGHFGESYWLEINRRLKKFKNKQFVIVTMPETQCSIAYRRYYKRNHTLSNYYIEEQRSLYTPLSIERMFNQIDIFVIRPEELLFTDSVDRLNSFAVSEMAMFLDRDECSKMHQIWINMIKNGVA